MNNQKQIKMNVKKLPLALILSLAGVMGCTSDDPVIAPSLRLLSYELHLPGGQVDTDQFFYQGDTLKSQIRTSTGWIDQLTYSFEYANQSTLVYFDQNGVPSDDFIQKEEFDNEGLKLRTIVKKEDGSLFATYNYVYTTANELIAQLVESSGQTYTDSIEVDDRGNITTIKRKEDGSVIRMTFDDHPNPFYQAPIIVNMFRTDSPNNITSFQLYQADTLFYEKNFQYQYDSDNLPARADAQGSLPLDPPETFYFFYE